MKGKEGKAWNVLSKIGGVTEQKWVIYPPYSDRKQWNALLGDYKDHLIRQGEQFLKYNWQVIKGDRQKWRVIRSTYRFRRSMEISSTKDDTRENQAMPHYFRRQEFLLSLGIYFAEESA